MNGAIHDDNSVKVDGKCVPNKVYVSGDEGEGATSVICSNCQCPSQLHQQSTEALSLPHTNPTLVPTLAAAATCSCSCIKEQLKLSALSLPQTNPTLLPAAATH